MRAGGDFGYFDVPAAFYERTSIWYREKPDTPIEKEWIIPANGTIASIHSAAHLVSQNRPILMFTPVYGVFKDVASHFWRNRHAAAYQQRSVLRDRF